MEILVYLVLDISIPETILMPLFGYNIFPAQSMSKKFLQIFKMTHPNSCFDLDLQWKHGYTIARLLTSSDGTMLHYDIGLSENFKKKTYCYHRNAPRRNTIRLETLLSLAILRVNGLRLDALEKGLTLGQPLLKVSGCIISEIGYFFFAFFGVG